MLSEVLTFIFFILIGLEIREGLAKPKDAALPAIAALGGMVFPALFFYFSSESSSAWAVAMPTDVALAIGALSFLGNRVSPAVRLFLLTLAVADDFFSLVVLAIFFREDLHLSSAIYTLGAASIGFLLPYRKKLIAILSPIATFLIIPIYISINLLAHLDFSQIGSRTSIALALSRVIGKVLGITLFTWIAIRLTSLSLPSNLDLKEVAGVGLLCGMGLTVSLVIADITVSSEIVISQIRMGLILAAVLSATAGLAWLKRFPASL